MICIGIDFSINHPAATILNVNNKRFNFVTVYNDVNTSVVNIDRIAKLNEISDLDIVFTNKVNEMLTTRKKPKTLKLEYSQKQKVRLDNYIEVVNEFIKLILKFTQDSKTIIAIEGLSFGSKGDQVFELGQATGILKHKLITSVLNNKSDLLYAISPMSLKASYLKGNASKMDIFNQFIQNDNNSILKESELYKYLVSAYNKSDNMVITEKEIKSPWNDIIDSYTALHYLVKNISNNGL